MILLLSTLGQYRSYKCVFYRIYLPSSGEGSSSSRTSVVAVSNLGGIALASAYLWEYFGKSEKIAYDHIFHIAYLTPLTLSTNTIQNDVISYLNSPSRILSDIADDLTNTSCKCIKIVNELIKSGEINDSAIKNEFIIANLSIKNDDKNCEKDENNLPFKCVFDATMHVYKYGGGKIHENIDYDGKVSLILVPLVGSFSLSKENNRLIIFREKSSRDIIIFGKAIDAVYLEAVYRFIRDTLNSINERDIRDKTLKFIVDTTHGLNIATTTMVHVLDDALPLIKYSAFEKGFDIDILYYNSGPVVIGRNDEETLKKTSSNNISYYYMRKDAKKLTNIIEKVKAILLDKDVGKYADILQGIYLLRYGLIPWGLYIIENTPDHEFVSYSENNYIITYRIKDSESNYRVSYDVREKRDMVYEKILAKWMTSIIGRILKDELKNAKKFKMKDIANKDNEEIEKIINEAEINCWSINYLDLKYKVKCYTFDGMIKIVNTSPLTEIVDEAVKIIFENEVDEWIEKPGRRLSYQVPLIFELANERMNRKCSNILRVRRKDIYYCITPMTSQTSIRNIIAHAGLTAVHRLTSFIFIDEKDKCKPIAICIGAPFPREFIEVLIKSGD